MKKGACYIFVLSLVVFLTSCSGVNQKDLKKEVFDPTSGILSQIKVGQSWDDLKSKANPDFWTVRETDNFYQLRKDYGGLEMILVNVKLVDGKVASYGLDINSETMSPVELKLFTIDLVDHLAEAFTSEGNYYKHEYNGETYTTYMSESLDDDILSIGFSSM